MLSLVFLGLCAGAAGQSCDRHEARPQCSSMLQVRSAHPPAGQTAKASLQQSAVAAVAHQRDLEAVGSSVGAEEVLWGECSTQQRGTTWKPIGAQCLRRTILYIKVFKTGSSTVGGVMRRIAARHGLYGVETKMNFWDVSKVQFEPFLAANHGRARDVSRLAHRRALPVMFITWVRDPIMRALSEYFHFGVSRRHKSPRPAAVIAHLRKIGGSFMTRYIQLERQRSGPAESGLAGFEFVGVTERMDESVVALKHVLGLPNLCDVLYISAKNSSGPPHKDATGTTFVPHTAVEHNPEVRAFLRSSELRRRLAPDLRLHAAANERLDSVIADIGKERFAADLREFRRRRAEADAVCVRGGQEPRCYWNDNGCYYDCLDKMCSSEQ